MKKIIYLAPLALLGVGVKVSANRVPTHISNALRIYEQENTQNRPVGQSENEQGTQQAKPSLPNGQNQPVGKVGEAKHISRLDSGLINEDSSVGNGQASQVMKISKTAIPTKQELNESKESVAGRYVQVQQNRVAQFNNGSKIYGLNNSNQLSKSNGDGYVITNAGTYNGRAVDIGVTINNVQNNQGSYTTKWSNGEKASQTGSVDNNFSYQNGVIVGVNPVTPVVPNQTRTHTETKNNTYQVNDVFVATESINGRATYLYILDPVDLAKVLGQRKIANMPVNYDKVLQTAGELLTAEEHGPIGAYYAGQNNGYYSYVDSSTEATHDITLESVPIAKFKDWFNQNKNTYNDEYGSGGNMTFSKAVYIFNNLHDLTGTYDPGLHGKVGAVSVDHGKTIPLWGSFHNNSSNYTVDDANDYVNSGSRVSFDSFGNDFNKDASYSFVGPTDVTYHLQLDHVNNGSLNYNYTVGVYDAQTGDLIKDLTADYKGKTGKTATEQDTAMNDAIKAKIQAINANTANAAYTGTAANDDVTFNKNTVHINYVDTRGESINVPGYDIDVDNLTSGNYQVPQNYVLANANGFKVTKNTHEVNGITVTDSYNFIDQGNNKVTDNSRTLSVVLKHGTRHIIDPGQSGLSNDAAANTFVINNGAKRQINSQSRHFGAAGVLDLVTNKITKQGDWLLLGKSNFDQTNINDDLVGYGNAIHSNLTFLTL